jgi:hypothetical protein
MVITIKKISDLMRQRNIELSQAKEFLYRGNCKDKIIDNLGDLTLNIENNSPNFGGMG